MDTKQIDELEIKLKAIFGTEVYSLILKRDYNKYFGEFDDLTKNDQKLKEVLIKRTIKQIYSDLKKDSKKYLSNYFILN